MQLLNGEKALLLGVRGYKGYKEGLPRWLYIRQLFIYYYDHPSFEEVQIIVLVRNYSIVL